MISKEQMIGGIKNVKTVELPMYDNEEIAIREISDMEYNHFLGEFQDFGSVQMTSLLKGNDLNSKEDSTNVKTTMAKMQKNRFAAKVKLVALALNNKTNPDKFTTRDVEQFKAGTVDFLVEEILAFSGLDDPEETEKELQAFREGE